MKVQIHCQHNWVSNGCGLTEDVWRDCTRCEERWDKNDKTKSYGLAPDVVTGWYELPRRILR